MRVPGRGQRLGRRRAGRARERSGRAPGCADGGAAGRTICGTTYKGLPADVSKGDPVLINDGNVA
ncbi:hypothetical protein AB0A98_41800, partial [Streptomyces chrestomyceticus]|uniref:hypothetical protein n=1 Tax=Streptomyces chrestomyceticus TaxID=68185 RepID=UPI0033E294B0